MNEPEVSTPELIELRIREIEAIATHNRTRVDDFVKMQGDKLKTAGQQLWMTEMLCEASAYEHAARIMRGTI